MRKTTCTLPITAGVFVQETVQCTALARLAYAASSPERSRTATMKKKEKTHPHRSSTDWRDPDWPEEPGWRDKRSTRDRRERQITSRFHTGVQRDLRMSRHTSPVTKWMFGWKTGDAK